MSIAIFVPVVAVLVFAGTSGRPSLLLAAARPGRSWRVIVGAAGLYLLALAALGATAAVLGAFVPAGLVAYIGTAPLLRGAGLLTSGRFRPETTEPPLIEGRWPALTLGRALLAGGWDTMFAVLPLFVARTADEVVLLVMALILGTTLVLLGARRLAHNPISCAWIRQHGPRIGGWALVVSGLFLLIDGGALGGLLSWR